MVGVLILALGIADMFASVDEGATVDNAVMVAGYVVMRVAMVAQWWIYFVMPCGVILTRRRDRSFGWGYRHIPIFGAVVAVGAGSRPRYRGNHGLSQR